jgi:hypothetical protein
MQVDTVEQRTGNARLVIRSAAGIEPAAAGVAGLGGAPAAAWIHRRHQHETRRIGDAMIGARDRDLAGFERLAQRVERLRLEFRNYVAVSPIPARASQ